MAKGVWVVNGVLLVVSLVGATLAISLASQVKILRQEYLQLNARAGSLEIPDRSKMFVVALPMSDQQHFQWRCYVPGNTSLKVEVSSGAGSSSSGGSANSAAEEFIARVHFYPLEDGELAVYESFGNGSSYSTIGSPGFGRFLMENWDRLEVTQLGDHGPMEIGRNRAADLLKIVIPPSLIEEAGDMLTPWEQKAFAQEFFKMTVSVGPG